MDMLKRKVSFIIGAVVGLFSIIMVYLYSLDFEENKPIKANQISTVQITAPSVETALSVEEEKTQEIVIDILPTEVDVFYSKMVNECNNIGIDIKLIFAIIEKESQNGKYMTSYDGHDHGLCQIRDVNINWLQNKLNKDIDLYNTEDNIMSCIYLIGDLINNYSPGNIHQLLMMYNCGPNGAKSLFQKGIYSTQYCVEVLNIMNGIDNEYERLTQFMNM